MTTAVYLDQNMWIMLLRQKKGQETEYEEVLERIKNLSESGEVIFPLSYIHAVETASASDRNGRVDEMVDFMLEISQGHFIAPKDILEKEEIRNKARQMLGLEYSMEEKVIGKGLPFMVGGRHYHIKDDSGQLSDQMREELLEAVESEWAAEKLLKDPSLREEFGDRSYEYKAAKELEEIREKNAEKFSSNDKQRQMSIIAYFRGHVREEFTNEILRTLASEEDATINKPDITDEVFESPEYAADFVKDFPSVYAYTNLTVSRDLQRHRDIDSNDLNDIMALSVAIPYCDLVLTEGFWENLASQSSLGEEYDTIVASDLSEIMRLT